MRGHVASSQIQSLFEARGISRKKFLKLCGALTVTAGLPQAATSHVALALEESVIGAVKGGLYPVIWIEGASCTGCTESFLQSDSPDPASVVLELLSLNYSETLSAAAGYSMEKAKEQTIRAGNYLLIYEGAVQRAWKGNALRVAGKPGVDHLLEAATNAIAVVALGSCAVNGGWVAAEPNLSHAMGVQKFLKEENVDTPVINIPGCPANPEWLISLLVDILLLTKRDLRELDLDGFNRPRYIYGQTIHDNCERRGHFENGEFVYEIGSKEEALGFCLYPLGCRGPQTMSNCGLVRWNNRQSWCIQSGAPCIGCCEANPDNPKQNWVDVNTPFRMRHRDIHIAGFTLQPAAVAGGASAIAAGALAIHAVGMKKSGRMNGGASFETIRVWDAKHPDKAIGVYDDIHTVIDKENVDAETVE